VPNRPANRYGTTAQVPVESDSREEPIVALRAPGQGILREIPRARDGYGGYQGLSLDGQCGVLPAPTEARKEGAAVGH
jgi:hypothetical protein